MPKEDFFKQLDDIEFEISKVYYTIMDSEEITLYKKALLTKKMDLLSQKFSNILKEINLYNQNEPKNINKKALKLILLGLLVMIFLFIIPIVVLPFYYIFFKKFFAIVNQMDDFKEFAEKVETEEFDKKLMNIKNIYHNCETFMVSKIKKREERLIKERTDSNQKVLAEDIANNILQIYLLGVEVGDIDDNIKIALIRMLQDDLGVQENNLDELLKLAKEKISLDNLKLELNLSKK